MDAHATSQLTGELLHIKSRLAPVTGLLFGYALTFSTLAVSGGYGKDFPPLEPPSAVLEAAVPPGGGWASTGQRHIVQPGETLVQIARMYGVGAARLAHYNNLANPEDLLPGKEIELPEPSAQESLSPVDILPALESADLVVQQRQEMPGRAASEQPGRAGAASNFGTQPYAYFGDREPTANVLRNFSSNYSLPVVISEGVDGVVSGRIGPLAPVEFLDHIAQLNGLIWYFDGNTLYVYKSNEIEKQIINLQFLEAEELRTTLMEIGIWDNRFYWRARSDEGIVYLSGPPRYMELVTETARLLDSKAGERKKSHLTVRVFPLRYAWADDRSLNFRNESVTIPGVASILRNIIQGGGVAVPEAAAGRSLPGLAASTPAGGSAVSQDAPPPAEGTFINADRRLNAVIVHDLSSRMSMYESLVNTLDKPLSQVEINVSIIDINTQHLNQIGVNWNYGRAGGDFIRFNPFGGQSPADIANSFSTVVNITSGQLLSQVNVLSESGNAKVLARPSVLTLDNMEAVLDNSQTFYVRVAGQEAAELFPVTYGSVLKVTPRIVNEPSGRKLHLDVNIQDGAQVTDAQGADDIPVVKNSSISTQAVIDENESLLVGGYYFEERTERTSKVPILGDVPFLGAIFRNTVDDKRKNVRLFLITPRIHQLM